LCRLVSRHRISARTFATSNSTDVSDVEFDDEHDGVNV
jgi:hypothetical protein